MAALIIVYATSIPGDRIPTTGRVLVIWLLIPALPYAIWAYRILRIGHPIQRKDILHRAFSIYWITLATFATLAPALAYTTIFKREVRIQHGQDKVPSLAEMLGLESLSSESALHITLFVLLWLAYSVHYLRHGPRRTFIVALGITIGAFIIFGLLSTVTPWFLKLPLILSISCIVGSGIVLTFPRQFGYHLFALELGLCVMPTIGLSSGLAIDGFQVVDIFELAATGCGAVVLFSPVLYLGVERLRARPA
ncbi:MAG: hypothetical protein KC431_19355 [Myxococcales bacterium]|nr:hypothetical protein [Myxococcales bacterium]